MLKPLVTPVQLSSGSHGPFLLCQEGTNSWPLVPRIQHGLELGWLTPPPKSLGAGKMLTMWPSKHLKAKYISPQLY